MIAPVGFLATPVGEHLPGLVREALTVEAASRPDAFGPYRVTGEIGRGGMGAVYEAERADRRYDRRVAIKTVARVGPSGRLAGRLGGRRLADRFEAERRILAGLEHENIARLYDAGATPGDVPYFVMELVDGRRIDVYCDEEDLGVDARLDLFDRVCAAVEYAHAKFVVHGDIKPGNVLVARDGTPKLLDFGVARLLVPETPTPRPAGGEGDQREDSEPPGGAMTPEYASPEQLRGEPPTATADVYSLGVLLYVLLAGRHPYPPMRRDPIEIERMIREAPIGPPSEAIAADPATGARRRRLRGDLDAIVLKAIRPDAAARYASVGDLRRDLRDFREARPVSARPATARYRAGRFLRRHRAGLAAAALVFLSLSAGLAGTAWQARAAERQAVRAERTRDYLVGLFETFDPDAAGIGPVTAEELLDRGAERLASDLSGQPATRAELGGVLGRLYQRMGLYEKARPLLTEARAGLRDAHGERHPETAGATARLAYLLYEQGEFEEAETLSRSALDTRRELFGDADTTVANSLTDLGAIRSAQGEWEEAESLYARALDIDRRAAGPEQVATDLSNLGVVHIRQGEHDEARALLEESLAMRREVYGDRHTMVATGLLNLAEAERAAGRYDESRELLLECIELRRGLLGDRHPHVALAYSNLGSTLLAASDLEAAEEAHREALAIRRAAFGDAHPEVGASLNSLGVVAYFRGDHSGAADRFAEVLPIWREQLGEEHPNVLTLLNNLGSARREAGEYEEAERALRRVLEVRRRVLEPDHPDIGQSLNNLAFVLYRRGAMEEAELQFREAIRSWRGSLGDEHPTLAFGFDGLGRLLLDTGRLAEAETAFREALRLREDGLEEESSLVVSSRAYLGLALVAHGRADAAQRDEGTALLAYALPLLEERWGPDSELVRRVRAALGE